MMKKIFTVCAAMVAAMTLSAQTPIVKTCAEAAAIALALPNNNEPTTEVYSITGYVTNVVSAVSKRQQTFWMDDEKGDKKTFESYYCNLPTTDLNTLNVGDKVKIVGPIMKYNTTPEMKNGDITILERVVVQCDTFTVTTCEAYDECSSLSNGDASTDYFIVKDAVVSVDDANENYGWQSITFKCDEDKLLVGYHIDFGGKDNFCAVGDTVEIIGTLKNYGGKMGIEGKGRVMEWGSFLNMNNIIVYTATKKLTTLAVGVKTFGPIITSHTFVNGVGIITCGGEITTIGYSAFYGCSGLTSVTIPNSVTTIGGIAFYGCSGLTSVTIPNSVTSIGEWAFYYCDGLTSVTIPSSVTTIGEKAFSYCSKLTSVTIPNSVTTIGGYAFEYCSGLTSINVDAANTHYASIDGVLFNYAKDTLIQYPIGNTRTSYTIPNFVTAIGNDAFSYCSKLTSVTIPNSVTTIGNYAFRYCSGLTSITIPNSVTTIGNFAFYKCSSLTSVTIPNSVTKIGDQAFLGCSGLTSVTIPNSVTTIGENAFAGCSGLTSVTIGNSVTTIGEKAFYNCSGLTDIYCYAQIPPTCTNTNAFDGINEHCYIYVPVGTMRAYQFNKGWSRFYHFFEISEVPVVGTDQVGVEVTNNTAVFSWPVNPTASSYTLVIKKNDEVFCTLTFNSLGQLVGMAFAPARGANNDSSAQSTAYGYSFMVSNLDASSTYDYTFTAKDASNNVLTTTTGQFKTGGTATDILPLLYEDNSLPFREGLGVGFVKFIHNGRLLIERNGILYNAHGARVK